MPRLPDSEFYLVQDDAGRSMCMGAPGQDDEGRFNNYETAEFAAKTYGSIGENPTVYVVKHVRTVLCCVDRKLDVTVNQL